MVKNSGFVRAAGTYAVETGWTLADTGSGAELMRGAVLIIQYGQIADIKPPGFSHILPVLDASTLLVLPGIISAHTHVIAGLPTRGVIEAGRPYLRPLELLDELDEDDLDDLTAANLAEIVRSGGTTQLEMSLSLPQAESYVRTASKWGVRGYPSVMVPGSRDLERIWFRKNDNALLDAAGEIEAWTADSAAFARRVRDAANPLLVPMMAAHATDTQTPDTLKALKSAIDELQLALHIHIAQRTTERDAVQRLWGCSPVRFLEKAGLLDGPVFGAHMTAVDWPNDASLLRDRGVVYAHCPSAGGAGVSTQPYPEALHYNVASAIGLDTHSNDCIENLKLAMIKGRVRAAAMLEAGRDDVTPPTIEHAVASSARVTADGLGRNDLGRIAKGARADFLAIDVVGPMVGSGSLPPEPLNNLLYANGNSVQHVAIDGRLKLIDGVFVADDENRVRERAGRVMDRIWGRLEREDWFKQLN